MRRMASVFLAVLLCMSCVCSPMAYAAEGELPPYLNEPPLAENPTYLNEPPLDKEPSYLNEPPLALSAAAQAFVDAVAALDREAILSTANAWGLAHQAWERDKDDPVLNAALDEAVAASDEASAALYAAEDLFYGLSEDEQCNAEVQAAFNTLMTLAVTMQTVMENPSASGTGGTEPPTDEEIAAVLYDALPDSPTGSYIGSRGLPVATGETKVGISEWKEQLLSASAYRMDENALNSDSLSVTVPLQAGETFAIVPILAQVEYPAEGSSSVIILPENAVLLSQDGSGNAASPEEAERILHSAYSETSAAVSGFFVRASEDFTARLMYTDADGNTLEKTLDVHVDRNAETTASALYAGGGSALFEERPTPSVTTGKVTDVQNINGMWLIWFNGEPAYCCNYGLWAAPAGCPTYTYSHTSIVGKDQYTPGDHYGNQVNIWGGLGQMSLGLLAESSAGMYTAQEAAACYTDAQKWIMKHYPDSDAGLAYRQAIDQLTGGAAPYVTDTDYYCYVYQPPTGTFAGHSEWQTIAVIGPKVKRDYYAAWSAEPQTASGEFDLTYTVNTDKVQLATEEKVDGAVIEIEPIVSSGYISGGTWALDPAGRQTVTTGGHTMDNAYQDNGGDAAASWSLHYSVSKTSTTERSGNEGPYQSQAEADAAAEAAKAAATAQLQDEAQMMMDDAIEAARKELVSLRFNFVETGIPYGFDETAGTFGSNQTIIVPANTSADYTMRNDEWSIQVRIDKRDSETGERIRGDAAFAIFEWDKVLARYVPTGGYNQYRVERQTDGTYMVKNHSAYATADPARSTLYYTQRNEGKFIIAEVSAPSGYYGDWSDLTHPGEAGTVKGKRAYAIEITKANDGRTVWLDNADYNANIGTEDNGGTRLDTGNGIVSVTVSANPILALKTYFTDRSGIAANEDGRMVIPVHNVFQNDRVLGEIVLSKVDLDAMRYLAAGSNGDAALDGAVYDLYAAEDIRHPDGVTGIVDYSKITDVGGNPIWHTSVLTNSGWDTAYLPVLKKDRLVASAAIEDGRLAFANLYLGKYYLVERATGIVLPLDGNGQMIAPTTYPVLDRQLQPSGATRPLTVNSAGEYTEYLYRNRYSSIAVGRAMSGSRTYDGYYQSFASGYLCDEVNHYVTLAYGNESGLVIRQEVQSADEVQKSGFSLNKLVSTTGQPGPAVKLDGAGFTVYRVSDLSRAAQFQKNPDGTYQMQSILDAYRADSYDQNTPKYDFRSETQAIATMYEGSAASVEAYNRSLTADGDNANGSGRGWVAAGKPNQYRLSEIFTNEEGILRVDGLPTGQYLVVETTVPKDVFQAAPFLVTVDASAPQSVFCTPQGSVTTPSGSQMSYLILDEEIEGYLQLIKVDAETGKPVKLANTAFSIFHVREDGTMELVKTNDPASGNASSKTSVFYTDENGMMKTPEKLPLGRYRVVEVQGPKGYFNDESFYVDFEITTERIYEVTGSSADGMDDFILSEKYFNRETLGRITIRKEGEVLADLQNGQFIYEKEALAGAVFEIRAHGDVFTADHQTDADGNRTVWYADGDLVATVTTGADGQIGKTEFAPTRTPATYDFLSVSHNGNKGEVTVILPLGSYDVCEVKAPYGYTLTEDSYTVTLGWDSQSNDLVLAQTIVSHADGEDTAESYSVVNIKDASTKQAEQQKLMFTNERVRSMSETGRVGIGLCKQDRDSAETVPVAGAVYELYTADAIYSADGKLLAKADTLLGTAATDTDGLAAFDVDVPIRGEKYGESKVLDATGNSGRYYLREVSAPDGYLIERSEIPVEFTYAEQQTAWQLVTGSHADKQTEVAIEKLGLLDSNLDGSFLLPGAMLTVTDWNGNVVDSWTSEDSAHVIRGLALDHDFSGNDGLGHVYTLTEIRPADGYTTARSIQFKLMQAQDENGGYLQQTEVWVLAETPSAEAISGSIVSPIAFADDAPEIGILATLKGVAKSLVDALTGSAEDADAPEQAVMIADWRIVNKTLFVSFTKEATSASIEKCLRESDFAGYMFERVYIENGTAPDFFADQQITERPDDAEVTYAGEWTLCGAVTMLDAPTVIRISKIDITTHDEIEGAALQITDQYGNLVDEWISGSEPHVIEGRLTVGETYILTETLAPTEQGYVPAASMEFTVQDDGRVQTVFMQDDHTKLTISKTDIATGEELPGATLQIVNADGEVVEEWVSGDEPHYFERIPVGQYTLVETSAPDGYLIAEDVAFEMLPTGEIQSVEMRDDFTKVSISKTDIATGEELPGAALQITDADGKIVEEWISASEPHLIERLPFGKYTLAEISAPAGYLAAESIVFEVDATGEIQKVEMKDERAPVPETPVPQTGDLPWLPATFGVSAALAAAAYVLVVKKGRRNEDA